MSSVGTSNTVAQFGDTSVDIDEFDKSDSSWKAYGGYIIDVPLVDFAVELAYLDFMGQRDSDDGTDLGYGVCPT